MQSNVAYTSQGMLMTPIASAGMVPSSEFMKVSPMDRAYAQTLGFQPGEDIPISATALLDLERYKRQLETNHLQQEAYANMELDKLKKLEEQADKYREKSAKWKGNHIGFMSTRYARKAVKTELRAHEHKMSADNYTSLAHHYRDERRQFEPPKPPKELEEKKEDNVKSTVPAKVSDKKGEAIEGTKAIDKTAHDAQPGPSQPAPPHTEEFKKLALTDNEKNDAAATARAADLRAQERAEIHKEHGHARGDDHALSMMTSERVVTNLTHPYHHPDAPHNIRKSAPSVPTTVQDHRPKRADPKSVIRRDSLSSGDGDDDTDSDDDAEYEYQQRIRQQFEVQKRPFWDYFFPAVQPTYTQDVSTAAIRNGAGRQPRPNLARSWQTTRPQQ